MSGSITANVPRPTHSRRLTVLLGLLALALSLGYWRLTSDSLPSIGAITTVTELNSGLSFKARVDTGADYCSIHCQQVEVPEATDDPLAHVGKNIRFLIANSAGETAWVVAKLADHSAIRNATSTGRRYMVYLPLRIEGVEDTVLVTLNDRTSMRFPFLVGRNLLHDRFTVDVRHNADVAP
jgi:hypothetical protein